MKNKYLESLSRNITAVGYLPDVKFKYALAKNLKRIQSELELLQEVVKPAPEFMEYDGKRIELCAKFADKDKDGKPKQENNQYIFTDKTKFDIEFEKLKKDNKKVLDAREKQIKDFTELLDKEGGFIPHKISQKDLPKELTASQLAGIMELVEDNE